MWNASIPDKNSIYLYINIAGFRANQLAANAKLRIKSQSHQLARQAVEELVDGEVVWDRTEHPNLNIFGMANAPIVEPTEVKEENTEEPKLIL